MADQDCDYCHKTSKCKFAWEESNCRVTEIEEAKSIVNPEFIQIRNKYKLINEVACNDNLGGMLNYMDMLINDSKEELE